MDEDWSFTSNSHHHSDVDKIIEGLNMSNVKVTWAGNDTIGRLVGLKMMKR